MKKIRIKKISYSSFKGQTKDITFGEKTRITGRNGSGKTTVIKAWLWLMTGKTDPVHGSNHEIFDNRFELNEHTPVSSVKAWVEIDGTVVTFERTAKAKFVRKKGALEYTKDSSDEYKYFIDDIRMSQKEFDGWIENNICPVGNLPFCMSGEFFTVLSEDDKDKARIKLESLIGDDVTSELLSDDKYSDIRDGLEKYGLDDFKKRCRSLLKPLSDEISSFPILLQEKMNELMAMQLGDPEYLKKDIEETKKRISDIDTEILKPAANPERIAALQRIDELTKKMAEERKAHDEREFRERSLVESAKHDRTVAAEELERVHHECERLEQTINECIDRKNVLNKELETAKKSIFSPETETCPYCGQRLPEDAIDKQRAEFNEKRAKAIEKLTNEGLSIVERIEKLSSGLQALKEKIKDLEEKASAEIKEYVCTPYDGSAIQKEIDSIEIPTLGNDTAAKLGEEKKALIEKLDNLIDSLTRVNIEIEQREKKKEEIETLKEKQRETGLEMARIEREYQLAVLFESEKADAIGNAVNKHLKGCKIQMYELQKNGERKESCTICDEDGVKFSTMNNANRQLTCIQMQRLFCELNSIDMPILCDESSIYDSEHTPDGEGQYIYLFCSDDKELTITTIN